jgi:uncharacterized protein (TIGR03086 family)
MSPEHQSGPAALERVFGAVGQLVHHIEPEQWASPTPCTEWSVRQVVTHLVGMNLVFAAMLADEPLPARAAISDDDLPGSYDASASLLVNRFREPGLLERSFNSPRGSATGSERLQIRMYDLLAHGWDIARATGQPDALPDDLAEAALVFATEQLAGTNRDGRFAPPQPYPAGAGSVEQLVAFLGRDLSWPG